MYTITQDKKNIDGAVKTTYGIKCDEVSVKDVSPNKEEVTELIDRLEPVRIVTLSFARCD